MLPCIRFGVQGINHTSLRDLLDAMQISRSSLYHIYGNKEALFKKSLSHYREQLLAQLAASLAEEKSAWCFIERLLSRTAEQAESEQAALGCFIFNTATELGSQGTPEADAATQSVRDITGFFVTVMAQAQQEGSISQERDVQSSAYFLTLSISGLRMLLKSGATQQQAKQVVENILRGLR